MIKRLTTYFLSFLSAFIVTYTAHAQGGFSAAEYKKALWMTTRMYGGQRSGDNNWLVNNHLPSGVDASLRGKCFSADQDTDGYDLSGGWHDCGDHVKFGQTEFYSAYMLLKGYAEFPTGYGDYYSYDYQNYITGGDWSWEGNKHKGNGIPDVLEEVKHATDYFIKCTRNATTFYYQVGDGGPDHTQWVTAVKMQALSKANGGQTRTVHKNPNDASMPSFCGATLALMSRLYKPYDAAYANLCLQHAIYAYTYAKAHPGVAADANGGSFYGANDNWKDDYSTMCAELFFATNTNSYKDEALSYTISAAPGQGKDIYGKNYGFDYANNGDIAIYNQALLGNANAITVLNTIVNNFYLGNVQPDGQFNGGNTGWGPLRYNANTAFIVALWQKLNGTSATPNAYIYKNIDYLLGKNSSNQSFVVGFGAKSPAHPHHRNIYLNDGNVADNLKNALPIPAKNAQFGGLVGGTRSPGSFIDQLVDFRHTEGGIDYNACLVGVLGYLNSVLSPVVIINHPVPDLGPDQSICGVSSILLNSKVPTDSKKTFQWFKNGAQVQAPSTTANTFSVTSAGTYVCVLDSAGKWTTNDTVKILAILPDVALGSARQLCNPATALLDAGASGTGIKYQWQKNGVNINGATSKTYTASSPATYKVIISASGCTDKNGSVVVTSLLPTVTSTVLCKAGQADMSVSGSGGPYKWYTAATNGTLLTTGNTYKPSITSTTTYYIEDGSSASATAGPATTGNGLVNPQNAGSVGIQFTAAKAFTITQLKVLPYVYNCNSGDNVSVTFQLKQGSTILGTYTPTAAACTGVQTGAPFNAFYTLTFTTPVTVPGAGNYELSPSAGNQLVWFDGGANFTTMDAAGIMDITDDTRTDKANSYPGIFDIKIQSGSSCARAQVTAVVDASDPNCQQPVTTALADAASTSGLKVFPNPSSESFTIQSSMIVTVKIVDVLGREIEVFNHISEEVFGSNLSPGIYHVVFYDEQTLLKTVRIIKQ